MSSKAGGANVGSLDAAGNAEVHVGDRCEETRWTVERDVYGQVTYLTQTYNYYYASGSSVTPDRSISPLVSPPSPDPRAASTLFTELGKSFSSTAIPEAARDEARSVRDVTSTPRSYSPNAKSAIVDTAAFSEADELPGRCSASTAGSFTRQAPPLPPRPGQITPKDPAERIASCASPVPAEPPKSTRQAPQAEVGRTLDKSGVQQEHNDVLEPRHKVTKTSSDPVATSWDTTVQHAPHLKAPIQRGDVDRRAENLLKMQPLLEVNRHFDISPVPITRLLPYLGDGIRTYLHPRRIYAQMDAERAQHMPEYINTIWTLERLTKAMRTSEVHGFAFTFDLQNDLLAARIRFKSTHIVLDAQAERRALVGSGFLESDAEIIIPRLIAFAANPGREASSFGFWVWLYGRYSDRHKDREFVPKRRTTGS